MAALYSPGSVSYFRNKNSWKEVIWTDDVPAVKPDAFMYVPHDEAIDMDHTAVLIAAFSTEPDEFKRNWLD